MDHNVHSTTLGVGGSQNPFKTAQNFHVNDPRFFKNRATSSAATKRDIDEFLKSKTSQTVRGSMADGKNLYVYLDQSLSPQVANLYKTSDVFYASKTMQKDGKDYYSKCLDSKGGSNVKIDHKSDTMSQGTNKI